MLAVLEDVFFTVLFPASGHGMIRKALAQIVWHAFRLLGRATRGRTRRNVLSYSGPVLVAVTLLVWLALLVVGWAMIYKPALGTGLKVKSDPFDVGWFTAIYYSGYTLSTLGTGDVVPVGQAYRLLTIVEAALGFASISMVVTYFLSVYSSLTDRNAFAQGLHHLTGDTGDAADLLARIADGEHLDQAKEHLATKADFLRRIYQSHRFYPVLRHFHYRETFYALPRILLTALDTAALIDSAIDRNRYAGLLDSVALDDLRRSALALTRELVPDRAEQAPSEEIATRWRERYAAATRRLRDAGLVVREDLDRGGAEYVRLRAEWDPPVRRLAEAMLYEWSEIQTGE